ncbi:MAG TPA: hypothetical protein ENH41_02155, partial [Candidatus Omnitrophica bacterium]|nr:hypothetical protein [Candidatus Omnitrophota bacterium]
SFIAVFSVIGTLIPQNKQSVEYITRYGQSLYDVFLKTGVLNIYSAWWFIMLLVFLCFNLTACLFKRFVLKVSLLGTLLAHVSILVILIGALVGMFYGEKAYVNLHVDQSIHSFVSKGKHVDLGFSVRLDKFIYEENIDQEEKLLVYSKEGELLTGVSVSDGGYQQIDNSGYSVRVLRYVADFSMDITTKEVISKSSEPRNPAIEVELKDEDGETQAFWVFAAYPDIHKTKETNFEFKYQWKWRRPKDFISKVTVIKDGKEVLKKDVKVNSPLRFGGYSFFQSSYDKEHLSWSGLQIVKDPGVIVVYFGFFLLILGLIIIFYINPLIKRR